MKKFALLAALGAVIGTLARHGIGLWLPHTQVDSIPWAILGVNIAGALVIGACSALPQVMNNEARRFFLVTGVLGGFTTYSAFAVDVVNMSLGVAITYVALTFIAGISATYIGNVVVKK